MSLFLFPRFNLATERGASQRKSEQTREIKNRTAVPFKCILSAKLSHPQKGCATNTDQKGGSVSSVTFRKEIRAAPAKDTRNPPMGWSSLRAGREAHQIAFPTPSISAELIRDGSR